MGVVRLPAAALRRGLSLGDLPLLGRLPQPLTRIDVPDDLDAVTTISDHEVDPSTVGMTVEGVDRIWAAVERLYTWGMNSSIALCLRREGEVVLDRAIGHSHGNRPEDDADTLKTLATPATPYVIASASKSMTAMVVHLLDQHGMLHVDDRVAEYFPEFARHGKDNITVGHVLSHRAGVPNIPREALDLDHLGGDQRMVDILVDMKPFAPPGRFVAYHAISGGFILAEVVRRVTGKPLKEVLETEILAPLGFERLTYGVPSTDVHLVAEGHGAGLPLVPPLSGLFERALGLPLPELNALLNDPRVLAGVIPAGNIVATANEVSRFFELLRVGGTLDGVTIFEPRTIRRAIAEQSYMEFDFALGFPFRYGMGFMLGARFLSLYGPDTHHAFGHLGYTNIVTWADPERRTSGALLTSGKPILGPHLYDLWDVMRRITQEAPKDGLADSPLLVGPIG